MSSKSRTLLLVDDEPVNIQILHRILEEDGYEFLFATDGKSGLGLATRQRPDMILLDVMMPDMDGYEICRKLKDDPVTADIPVIFVTAMGQMEDEEKGLNLGAVDYLTKPLGPSIVRARVRNHMQLKAYRDRLEYMAMFDGLTGIANRRRFDETLEMEWKRAQRNRSPLSLILMDIDFFKPYNDNYGHIAGDECLKVVAKVLSGALSRPADFVARYGGEEFVCLLPDTDAAGAAVMTEQLLAAVRSANIAHEYSEAGNIVTMSFGCLTIGEESDFSVDQVIAEADKLLYQAKNSGRNQGVCGVV